MVLWIGESAKEKIATEGRFIRSQSELLHMP